MFQVPSNVDVVDPVSFDFGFAPSISILSVIQCVRTFEWNVEADLTKTKDFLWCVGEGPLFWWRVELTPGICTPNVCGASICSFIGPVSECCPAPCPPPDCISIDREIRHVMATSLEHLCERLNGEDCGQTKPKGFIRSVRKYLKPVLCCDGPGTDEFIDVDFIDCCCASLIDPCIMSIIFPCETPIPLPCPGPGCAAGISAVPFAVRDDLGPYTVAGFSRSKFEVLHPQTKTVWTRFGGPMPKLLKLKHNFSNVNVLKDFLKRNNLEIPDKISLAYRKNSNSWANSLQLDGKKEDWHLVFNCTPLEEEDGEFGWSVSFNLTRALGGRKKLSKVILSFVTNGFRDSKNQFELNFSLNTFTKALVSPANINVYSKVIYDEIGIFKDSWIDDPYLNIKIGL